MFDLEVGHGVTEEIFAFSDSKRARQFMASARKAVSRCVGKQTPVTALPESEASFVTTVKPWSVPKTGDQTLGWRLFVAESVQPNDPTPGQNYAQCVRYDANVVCLSVGGVQSFAKESTLETIKKGLKKAKPLL